MKKLRENNRSSEPVGAESYPTRTRTPIENAGNKAGDRRSDAISDALLNEQRLLAAFRQLSTAEQAKLLASMETPKSKTLPQPVSA